MTDGFGKKIDKKFRKNADKDLILLIARKLGLDETKTLILLGIRRAVRAHGKGAHFNLVKFHSEVDLLLDMKLTAAQMEILFPPMPLGVEGAQVTLLVEIPRNAEYVHHKTPPRKGYMMELSSVEKHRKKIIRPFSKDRLG